VVLHELQVTRGRELLANDEAELEAIPATVVICPTSRSAFTASFHPEIIVADQPTQVLCEMVGAVDAGALGGRIGHLTHDELRSIEDALLLVLDLP
jgi:mRNA-degrading endonuclease toxin of MazEF toxin-antitoxin module